MSNQSSQPTVVCVSKPRRKGYWILKDIYYCPLCGVESVYQGRVYDRPKPKEWADRNKVIESWDYCDAL